MSASSSESPVPVNLKNEGDTLVIEWSDGVAHRLRWRDLRELCPCATCRTKREQPPTPPSSLPVLSPQQAQPLKPIDIKPVGNYAYNIQFNDGHNTGIYSLEYLRLLGERAD